MGVLVSWHSLQVPDWTVQLIGPDHLFADLIRVLFIRVQKETSEGFCFHTDK